MAWKHDDLAADLAAYLSGPDLMVWTDMQLGPSGSPRPDVYTIRKSYSKPNPLAFEVKISRSDLRSDTTSGKWQRYLKYAQGVVFAVPDGLCTVADIPETCGLIVRKAEVWRFARRPTLQSVTLPMDACMKLLIDGVSRTYKQREPQPRRAELWTENAAVRKKFGAAVAKAARDLVYVEQRAETLKADIQEHRVVMEAETESARKAAIEQAKEEIAALSPIRDELTSLLGVEKGASLWNIQRALVRLRAELSADARVDSAEQKLKSARYALESALSQMPASDIPTHTPQATAREVVALPARSETHTPLQGRAGLSAHNQSHGAEVSHV